MATQTIVFQCPITPDSVHVRNIATTTEISGSSITELDDGLYSAAFSSLSGDYTLSALLSSSLQAVGTVFNVTDTAATFYESDLVDPATLIPTANENADALLKRDWTSITGEAARSALNALRKLMNKVSISGSTLTVCKEDDTTAAYTQTVGTNASQDPISSLDTN